MCNLMDATPAETWLAKGREVAPRWAQDRLTQAADAQAAQALLRAQAQIYASTRYALESRSTFWMFTCTSLVGIGSQKACEDRSKSLIPHA